MPDVDEIEKEINLMIALDGVKGACQLLGVMTDTAEGYGNILILLSCIH
jgi:hypothetical protein